MTLYRPTFVFGRRKNYILLARQKQ